MDSSMSVCGCEYDSVSVRFKIYYFDKAPIINNDDHCGGALPFLHVIYNI